MLLCIYRKSDYFIDFFNLFFSDKKATFFVFIGYFLFPGTFLLLRWHIDLVKYPFLNEKALLLTNLLYKYLNINCIMSVWQKFNSTKLPGWKIQ